jgi:acylphosphatase
VVSRGGKIKKITNQQVRNKDVGGTEMAEQVNVRLHATVEGRVQGVGFRYFTQENAIKLGLTGWVRNRWNGTVEIVAEGSREELEKLLQAIGRGPRAGTTQDVKFDWLTASGEFKRFRVRMTG